MVTQEGNNVGVCSVAGNFDDAQTGVKQLFSDENLRDQLAQRGFFLSSANSINWGRVLPRKSVSTLLELDAQISRSMGTPISRA